MCLYALCMQSFSELCSRIECIVGFLMHTTFRSPIQATKPTERTNAYTPAGTHDDRGTGEMGRDGGGRPVRRVMKVRKAYRLRKQAVKSHSRFVEECLKMRAVEDRRTDNIKEEVEEKFSLFFLLLVFVCTLYALCMQSFSELCFRIECIVGFLMHTMHTSCEHNGSSDFRTA